MNTIESINNIVQKQREYFLSNETKSIGFRLKQLKKLKQSVVNHIEDTAQEPNQRWQDRTQHTIKQLNERG